MWIVSLVAGLAACYFPAVSAARGGGSRRLWIGLMLAGLFLAVASTILASRVAGPVYPILFSRPEGTFGRRMILDFFALIIRLSLSFCIGSFLATLLYRKARPASTGSLGLGSEDR